MIVCRDMPRLAGLALVAALAGGLGTAATAQETSGFDFENADAFSPDDPFNKNAGHIR